MSESEPEIAPDWVYRLGGVNKHFVNSKKVVVARGCDAIRLEIGRGDFVAVTGHSDVSHVTIRGVGACGHGRHATMYGVEPVRLVEKVARRFRRAADA